MRRLFLASVFATLPLGAHAADIEPIEFTWIEDSAPGHQAMIRFSLAGTYFDMDVTNGFAAGVFTRPPPDPAEFVRQSDDGFKIETWGITGDIEAWLPTAMGGYVVGGLEGAWVEADQNSQVLVALNDDVVLFPLPIDGSGPPTGKTSDVPYEISSSSEFYRIAGLAGIGADIATGTKVGLGAYVSHTELDLAALYSQPIDPMGNSLVETVQTWSGGLALFGESRHEMMRGFDVFVKGRAAALYAHGDLDASQRISQRSFSANDSIEEFAGLVEGQLGFGVALGPNAKISVFGGASWRNDVFEIVNPRPGPGDTVTGCCPTQYEPAHLKQTDLIEYSAGGEIVFTW